MSNEKQQSIGGLWLRKSKAGNKYMSGQIEIDGVKHNFTVFKNPFKEKDNQPDYKIMPDNKQQTEAKSAKPVAKAAPAAKPAAKPAPKKVAAPVEDDDSDSVPF